MEFSTNNVTALNALFTALKKCGTIEQPFTFSTTGIKLLTTICKGTAIVHWVCPPNASYTCSYSSLEICLDIDTITSILTHNKDAQLLRISLENSLSNYMHIHFKDEKRTREYKVALLNGDGDANRITESALISVNTLNDSVKIPCIEFKQFVSEVNSHNIATIRITYSKGIFLRMEARTLRMEATHIFHKDTYDFVSNSMDITSGQTITSAIPTRILLSIIKLTKASKFMKIYPSLVNNAPLVVEYDVNDIGLVRFYLGTRIEDSE